ncbi:MAG: hypothetical protein M1840_002685 [Geoglossum simile]|nr:MAG: hypothetical protein M1840_002685 [Geoglossum simile]
MVKRLSFIVHGQVQVAGVAIRSDLVSSPGVFFRKFTQQKATEYGLTGWVRNTEDGKVEGEAQGDEDSLGKLLADIDRGPPYAHVVKLEKAEKDTDDGEASFKIERTMRK